MRPPWIRLACAPLPRTAATRLLPPRPGQYAARRGRNRWGTAGAVRTPMPGRGPAEFRVPSPGRGPAVFRVPSPGRGPAVFRVPPPQGAAARGRRGGNQLKDTPKLLVLKSRPPDEEVIS
ncbi:hypothetical protein GCM10010246_45870 [Streptomyces cuspidosporus]|uniref:Uncharacterized protein n=1 Tax=Streptomyces cuspidosporus TaxID=66882 RepID=A0ABP5TGJ5_9ACTN